MTNIEIHIAVNNNTFQKTIIIDKNKIDYGELRLMNLF